MDLLIPTGKRGHSLHDFSFLSNNPRSKDRFQLLTVTNQSPGGKKSVKAGGRDGAGGLQAREEDLEEIGGKRQFQSTILLLYGDEEEGTGPSAFPGAVLDGYLVCIYIKQIGEAGNLL